MRGPSPGFCRCRLWVDSGHASRASARRLYDGSRAPPAGTRYGFPAEVHLWKLGGLAMSRASVPPARVARTKSSLRRDPIDHWVIGYCVRGTHFTNTAGTAVEVPAKVPFLSSLGQEFLHERTHIDRVSFLMARDAFRDIAPLLVTQAESGDVRSQPRVVAITGVHPHCGHRARPRCHRRREQVVDDRRRGCSADTRRRDRLCMCVSRIRCW
jgi:hypothetical protein